MAGQRTDPLLRTIEDALAPGRFVPEGGAWSFVEGVEAVRERVVALIGHGEAGRAVGLLEAFIAGCYEKSDEIDDSCGSFGQFVGTLFCEWIRARQKAKQDPAETAGALLSWGDHDDYGYCHGAEKDWAKVLDRAGLRALEAAVVGRSGAPGSSAHRRKVEVLRAIHEKRRDVRAYAALCESEDDLAPADCEVLAAMCQKRRRFDEALAWVDRGFEQENLRRWPNRSAWRLRDIQREVLRKLGRGAEALDSAFEDYRHAPSAYTYDALMEHAPKAQRAEWHARAIEVARGAGLSVRIELLVHTKETAQLAEVVEAASRDALIDLSHTTTEPAATRLTKPHPLLAAKLLVAMALRIVRSKKSKYYDAALEHLERARALLVRNGREAEWEQLVREIRMAHARQGSFMPSFERLAEGGTTREPSFLVRARRRWAEGIGAGETSRGGRDHGDGPEASPVRSTSDGEANSSPVARRRQRAAERGKAT